MAAEQQDYPIRTLMELQRQQGLKLTSVINFIIAIYTPLCKDEIARFVKLQGKHII